VTVTRMGHQQHHGTTVTGMGHQYCHGVTVIRMGHQQHHGTTVTRTASIITGQVSPGWDTGTATG